MRPGAGPRPAASPRCRCGRSRQTSRRSLSTDSSAGGVTGRRALTRARGRTRSGCSGSGREQRPPLAKPRARHNVRSMTVTFAEKLSRIPHYEPGTSLDDAKEQAETADAVKLASNESPFGPHPDVVAAIHKAAGEVNR